MLNKRMTMEMLKISVFLICTFILHSGIHLSSANKLYGLLNNRIMKEVKQTRRDNCCVGYVNNPKDLPQHLSKSWLATKRGCHWCPYILKVHPSYDNNKHFANNIKHWHNPSYQRKKRHKK